MANDKIVKFFIEQQEFHNESHVFDFYRFKSDEEMEAFKKGLSEGYELRRKEMEDIYTEIDNKYGKN